MVLSLVLTYSTIFFLLNLCLITSSQTYNIITLGSFLTADSLSTPWLSPSKDFAFGFQEIEPGSFLLAIWFNEIPEKTITWSANRDHLAPKGSKVKLTVDQSLILTDTFDHEIWRARTKGGSPAFASILNTGNLVLLSGSKTIIWESFNEPTDTLLPTQNMYQGTRLIADFSSKNYSSGRFSFDLDYNGNLGLYTTNYPLFNTLNTNYQSFDSQGLGYQVVFSNSGSFYLADNQGNVLADIFPNEITHEKSLYQRVILEYDGVLRHYIYKKSGSSSSGWSINSFSPENICTSVIQQTGSGVCGFNSYCKLGDDKRPYCPCPPSYKLLDPNNMMSGCFPNFVPQSCDEKKSHDEKNFGFKVLDNVDWPLSDYEHFENVSMEWCKEVCLGDCFCDVAIFREGGDCWKKKLPLSNGKNDSSVDRVAFIKIRISSDPSGGKLDPDWLRP